MDTARIMTSENGQLVQQTRQGLQVKTDENDGGLVFINFSESKLRSKRATGKRPRGNYKLGVMFLGSGDGVSRARPSKARTVSGTPTPNREIGQTNHNSMSELVAWHSQQPQWLSALSDYRLSRHVPDDDLKYFSLAYQVSSFLPDAFLFT